MAAQRKLTVRRRILLAQVASLALTLPLGVAAVLALLQMTVVVQEARTLGVRRIQAMGEVIELFREEAVLLDRYGETGDPSYAAAARSRSKEIGFKLSFSRLEDGEDGPVATLLDDYEHLSGIRGPPGDPNEADRAARHVLRTMQDRQSTLRIELEDELGGVVETGRRTAAATVLVVGVIWLIGMVGGFLLNRSLLDELLLLERGATALAAGDLSHRIELDLDDEFGRLAREFNRMATRLEALDRMKVDFFANVSHDLKTPLTSLAEAVDLLEDEVAGPLSDDQRELVGVMKTSTVRLRALVENVLDVSRLGAVNEELSAGDVSAAIDAVLEELRMLASGRDIRLLRSGLSELPPVLVNRGMVEQVLMNLVGNAIKFSPAGGAVTVDVVRVGTEVLAARGSGALEISVSDQGPGVPPEFREKVFQRFFQVPESGQPKGGTGLGLYICKRIVESHGGRISVSEAEGGGARVSFTLTLADAAGGAPQAV